MINEQDPMYMTKVNIEKILNAINTKKCRTQSDIAKEVKISQTNVSYNIRRINRYRREIWYENGAYKTNAKKPEDLAFIKVMETMLLFYIIHPEILNWKERKICEVFGIERFTISQFRIYAKNLGM